MAIWIRPRDFSISCPISARLESIGLPVFKSCTTVPRATGTQEWPVALRLQPASSALTRSIEDSDTHMALLCATSCPSAQPRLTRRTDFASRFGTRQEMGVPNTLESEDDRRCAVYPKAKPALGVNLAFHSEEWLFGLTGNGWVSWVLGSSFTASSRTWSQCPSLELQSSETEVAQAVLEKFPSSPSPTR